ncbi:unnamed protein product, partial [marine sediment metagenome]
LIELEGSEDFVQRNLNEFKEKITNFQKPDKFPERVQEKTTPPLSNKPTKKTIKTKAFSKNPEPIAFNTQEDSSNEKPSLKNFISQKKPQTNKEILVCIAFYLKKYLKLTKFKEGHISHAYLDLKKTRPSAFHQFFLDTKNSTTWITPGDGGSDTW